jgi:tRNA 2-thiouridine synthesizing protein E
MVRQLQPEALFRHRGLGPYGDYMTPEHWEVVNFLRGYYNEYQIAPAIRVLVKQMKVAFGPEKGNNKYLYELFPYGPAKQACKIAGLPKPTGCI